MGKTKVGRKTVDGKTQIPQKMKKQQRKQNKYEGNINQKKQRAKEFTVTELEVPLIPGTEYVDRVSQFK